MTIKYISPTGSGSRTGASWIDAAPLSSLSTMIGQAGPGGTVFLRADLGPYALTREIAVNRGGAEGAPVTIMGVDAAGRPSAAQLVGTRDTTWTPGEASGGEGFRLLSGADHLVFSNLEFRHFGLGAFRAGADISDLTIRNVSAANVGRFFQNTASGANTSASVDGLKIQDVAVSGYSDKGVFLQYDTRNVLLDRVTLDAGGQRGQHLFGVHLDGSVHDVVLRSVTARNNIDQVSPADAYRQGDGFATERGVHGVRFESTRSFNNADAGYDLKSSDTILIDAQAEGNKRNFRLWSDSITLDGVSGVNPLHRGGAGETAQVWMTDNSRAQIIDSVFRDVDVDGLVFDLEEGAAVQITGGEVSNGVDGWTARLGEGAGVTGLTSLISNGLRVYGNSSAERLTGSAGADRLVGAGGDDIINGGLGDDLLLGGLGVDTADYGSSTAGVTASLALTGAQNTGAGWDTIREIETLQGSAHADRLTGNGSANGLSGGAGDDVLAGGGGADRLEGGVGRDVLTGGSGADVFVFSSWSASTPTAPDRITDFADGDLIDLRGVDANPWLAGDQAFVMGPAGQTRSVTLAWNAEAGRTEIRLYSNTDRDADSVVIVEGVQLDASDFLL